MKEQLGYVAADCGAELAQSERLAEYKLPDGQARLNGLFLGVRG